MTQRRLIDSAMTLMLVFLCAKSAQAAKSYEFEGTVTGLGEKTVSLKNREQVLEFERQDLKDVNLGDEVTIWYTLDVQRAKITRRAGQQPGEAAPTDIPDLDSAKKKGIIQDDRAFYDARNDVKKGKPTAPPS
jgi:hypothetical protein